MYFLFFVLFVLLVAYFLYGYSTPSLYQRQFSSDLPSDLTLGGFLIPSEYFDTDEAEIARRVSVAFSQDTKRYKRHSGVNNPSFHEPHWGHTTGLLQGKLTINNSQALPEQFRVGLLKKNSRYRAVARPNFTKDPDLKLAVSRLAVKLDFPELVPNVYSRTGHANELDLLFAEGEMAENGVGRQFFARDARQLDMAVTLKPLSLDTLRTLANWRNLPVIFNVVQNVKKMMNPLRKAPSITSGWAGKPYFSAGAYALGEGAMKICLRPRQSHPISPVNIHWGDSANAHKQALDAWLAKGENASFDLCVQLAKPECIREPAPGEPPKSVMAAEFCDLLWDESQSPYIKVGVLSFKADDTLSRLHPWSPLQFNAWNTLPSMRPLGQIFRIRKHVHTAHSNTRLEHIYGAKPGTMVDKCPFR